MTSARAICAGRLRALAVLGGVLAAACAYGPANRADGGWGGPGVASMTYEKYFPLAQAGDPKYQTLIGFMHFFGEGAPVDRDQAHFWFHMAADEGYPLAQRNLAIMHRLGVGADKDLNEARVYASAGGIDNLERLARTVPASILDGGQPSAADWTASHTAVGRGEATYATFCAGCHGLNGIAAYIDSPSFALGERMEKPDAELLDSIRNGKGVMPSWGDKFPEDRLRDVLEFVRGLERSYEHGIAQALRRAPDYYFLFGPMEKDHTAYRGPFGN